MKKYNTPFFTLYENTFLVLIEDLGKEKALKLLNKIFALGLKKAYDAAGFKKGDPNNFVKVVSTRDKNVGLKVKFPQVTDDKIIYQFHTDPFPSLKGKVNPSDLDASYMNFKVNYLLGNKWAYKTTKHIWKGDKYTEHVIAKK